MAVSFEVAVRRAMIRDRSLFGSPDAVAARYAQRYIPGQRLYLETTHPERRADAVVRNDDHAQPTFIVAPRQV